MLIRYIILFNAAIDANFGLLAEMHLVFSLNMKICLVPFLFPIFLMSLSVFHVLSFSLIYSIFVYLSLAFLLNLYLSFLFNVYLSLS